MQWFYASEDERRGPVSSEQLANLIAQGLVSDQTLVWREGFANWLPWGEVAAANPLPSPSVDTPPVPDSFDSPDDAYDSASTEWSVDEFAQNLHGNGFVTSVGGCLSRAWENYKSFFGLALGAVFVAFVVSTLAGLVPLVGWFAGFLVSPHITAGVAWIFVLKLRGEEVEFGDVFAGFSRCYGKLVLVGLIQFGVGVAIIVAFMIPMFAVGLYLETLETMEGGTPPDLSGTQALGMGLIVGALFVFLSARFILSNLAAIDRPASAVDAFRFSWRVTSGRFWTILGLMIVMMLLVMAGALALIIGLIFVAPMYGAIVAQLYHDASESAAGRPPE